MPQAVEADSPLLHDIAGFALEEARRQGASQYEVDVSLSQGLGTTVRLGEVDTIEYQRDRGLAVTVYFGKRKGSASTADLGREAVRATVEKACAIARYTAEDPYAGLVEPEYLAREIPDLDLDHPWGLSRGGRHRDRPPLRAGGPEHRSADRQLRGRLGEQPEAHGRLWQLAGIPRRLLRDQPLRELLADRCRRPIRCTATTGSRRRAIRRSSRTRSRSGATAGRRALARVGARKLSTRKAPVIFSPDMARGLYRHFLGAIRGPSQYRKASFLLNAAGEQVFPTFVQMRERPHIPKGLASAPFDDEGAATRDRELVESGILQGYVLGSYSARRLGLKPTGNAGGVHNLIVQASGDSPGYDALLRRMGSGLLVTELMGQGVNGVTGDYSRGASGFWIEDGAVAYPVHEITIAGNLRDIYRNIVAVGSDFDSRGSIRCGSVLIGEMTIAGD